MLPERLLALQEGLYSMKLIKTDILSITQNTFSEEPKPQWFLHCVTQVNGYSKIHGKQKTMKKWLTLFHVAFYSQNSLQYYGNVMEVSPFGKQGS
jgi:hypothetical protein